MLDYKHDFVYILADSYLCGKFEAAVNAHLYINNDIYGEYIGYNFLAD